MRRAVDVDPDALAESELAAAWYAERNPQAAAAFADELDRAIGLIAEAAERWPKHIAGTRRYLLRRFPFHVVYRVDGARIRVIAIAHASRRPGYWTDRR